MKQKELELLVSLGKVASIDVRRPQGAAGWLVICQCEGYVPGALAGTRNQPGRGPHFFQP